MKLYQLTQTYAEILELDLEETDLDTVLDSLEGTVAEKAEGILMVMKTLEAEQDAYKKEIDRLAALSSKAKNKSESMKKYLSYSTEALRRRRLRQRLHNWHTASLECQSVTFLTSELSQKTLVKQMPMS